MKPRSGRRSPISQAGCTERPGSWPCIGKPLSPQAETTLQATLSAYTTDRTDFLDLLDAERMLFSLETGYEDTFARYLKITAALERALGVRSLADLDAR